MSFMYSYKCLEKICKEQYNDINGVTAYINDMLNTTDGAFYVPGWAEDLKRLKHYRWIRSQISHNPDCTEENMYEPEAEQWLNDFRNRILSSNDPISLYRKAKNQSKLQNTKQLYSAETPPYNYFEYKTVPQKSGNCFTCIIGGLIVMISVICFIFYLLF